MRLTINWPYPEPPAAGTALTFDDRHAGHVVAVSPGQPAEVVLEVTDPDAIEACTGSLTDLGIGYGDAR